MVALLCCLLSIVGGATSAHADEEPGRLRIAHLSSDSPAIDVALTPAPSGGPTVDAGTDVARALGYGDVGGYRDLAPGSYAVSVRAAGAPPTTPPALSLRLEVPSGSVRTLALSGAFADLALLPLADDLTAPADGTARVRVLAAAAGAPTVDVSVEGGPAVAVGLPFAAASAARPVPAGPARLRLDAGGRTTTVPVDLVAGTVVSLLVLDAPDGGLTARAVVDAAVPAVVPVGGVAAGGRVAERFATPGLLDDLRPLRARFPLLAAALSAAGGARTGDLAPVRVRAPAAGIDATLAGSGLDAVGGLAVPADPSVAGWYVGGPRPGDPGPAVLAGHVDWAGRPAVFQGLHRLVPGDEVVVDRADGSAVRFAVERVVQVGKGVFPTRDVYGPVPGAELRLITCGGAFDRATGSYADNVVVFARRIG
ncbi:Sortase family protein [Blastococcus aurantiacus]|uniref:Sortase family protein n=1 Tax=Blastococcus aurantiacus TaxID=1550231 RepID=A0A1G7KNC2_9ACTN|nr:class F sortase [Blastococcus aurantiacus]SDF38687.1 Sortase family protein [Blastococcus aurantiacus]